MAVVNRIESKTAHSASNPLSEDGLRQDLKNKEVDSGIASYGALGHVPPRLPTISFLVHFGVNLTASYPNIV